MDKHLILALDLGTTHVKAGVVNGNGCLLMAAKRAVTARRDAQLGLLAYDPHEMWAALQALVGQVGGEQASAISITSMAETGLLVDRRTLAERTPLIAWHDASAQALAERLLAEQDEWAGFRRRGLRLGFKYAVMKLLWLKERHPDLLDGAVWLSAADWAAMRLTGECATDPSLASRTFALDPAAGAWDTAWLRRVGLPEDIFPPIVPNGRAVGVASRGLGGAWAGGARVFIAGHDHVCAAALVGGAAFNSMGTAESLVGAFPARALGAAEDASGFSFGRHVLAGQMYWMGGLSSSGAALDWALHLLGDPPPSYAQAEALLTALPPGPSGLRFYPYLNGRGAPHSDPRARARLDGLSLEHGRAHLLKAVLEGLCCEVELMRRRALDWLGVKTPMLYAAGGGARSPHWMQLKADVTGCPVAVLRVEDVTLPGAALQAMADKPEAEIARVYAPDVKTHAAYEELYAAWEANI